MRRLSPHVEVPAIWDQLVFKCHAVIESYGNPVITGCSYLDPLPKTADSGHIVKTDESARAVAVMLIHLRDCAFGCWPWGRSPPRARSAQWLPPPSCLQRRLGPNDLAQIL